MKKGSTRFGEKKKKSEARVKTLADKIGPVSKIEEKSNSSHADAQQRQGSFITVEKFS